MADLSVIIPAYCQIAQLEKAVNSVLQQSLLPDEIIILDDAMPEPLRPTGVFANPVIHILRHDENRGAAAARNSAIAAAKGKFLAFLDADDYWHEDKLKRQFADLQSRETESHLLASATGFFIRGGKGIGKNPNGQALIPVACNDPDFFASGCWFNPGSTLMVERRAFDIVGPYDESLRRLEDYEWFLRFSRAGGELVVCGEVLSSILIERKANTLSYEAIAKKLIARYAAPPNELSSSAKRQMHAYLDLEIASQCNRQGRKVAMTMHLARSFAWWPRRNLHVRKFWNTPIDDNKHSARQDSKAS